MDSDIDQTVEYVLGCAETARTSLRAAIDIPTYVRGAIERFAPPNAGRQPLARWISCAPPGGCSCSGQGHKTISSSSTHSHHQAAPGAPPRRMSDWQAVAPVNSPNCSKAIQHVVSRPVPCAAGELLKGNFEVSVTTLPWLKNVRIKEFASKQALTQAVLASSCVMPGLPVWLDNHRVFGIGEPARQSEPGVRLQPDRLCIYIDMSQLKLASGQFAS